MWGVYVRCGAWFAVVSWGLIVAGVTGVLRGIVLVACGALWGMVGGACGCLVGHGGDVGVVRHGGVVAGRLVGVWGLAWCRCGVWCVAWLFCDGGQWVWWYRDMVMLIIVW